MSIDAKLEPIIESSSNKNKKSIIAELGGDSFIISVTQLLLDNAIKLNIENAKFKKTINFLKFIIPFGITAHRLYRTIENYRKKENETAWNKKNRKIASILKTDEDQLCRNRYVLGTCFTKWLLQTSGTENLKIFATYNMSMEEYMLDQKTNKDTTFGAVFIHASLHDNDCVLEIDSSSANDVMYYSAADKNVSEVTRQLVNEFVKELDCSKYYLRLTASRLNRIERISSYPHIYQIPKNLENEIRTCIKLKRKRNYLFPGRAGVGKTTSILKICNQLHDIPVIILDKPVYGYWDPSDVLSMTFELARALAPAILVIEDLDTYCLKDKDSDDLCKFIEELDGAKHKECIIVLSTVNELKNIHNSLLRRGRFDKVHLVDIPRSKLEIVEIFFNKLSYDYGWDVNKEVLQFSDAFFEEMLQQEYTHSDYAEMINCLTLKNSFITEEAFRECYLDVKETIDCIKNYDDGQSAESE